MLLQNDIASTPTVTETTNMERSNFRVFNQPANVGNTTPVGTFNSTARSGSVSPENATIIENKLHSPDHATETNTTSEDQQPKAPGRVYFIGSNIEKRNWTSGKYYGKQI